MSRRRLLLAATAALAVIAPLFAGVVVTHHAEQRISRVAACRLAPVGHVSATLDSSLAPVKLLGGSIGDVDIHAGQLERQGTSMDLDAHLRQVTTSGASQGGDATVTIPYAQLVKRLPTVGSGTPWTAGTDGTGLTFTGTTGTLGIPVTVHADITLGANTLIVTPTEVTVLGRTVPVDALPGEAMDKSTAQRLKPREVPLTALPSGVRATGAKATSEGLAVHLALTADATRKAAKAASGCAAA
ncbi:LmeA family phospholipid-binding protein [Streptomyces sp. NPDC101151]|uniref:LmeA family phospholipid-binding protein n=1 Tax=Streptomyces sp. NPDC101151 TaxID=3366115 RepID=UPI0037F92433